MAVQMSVLRAIYDGTWGHVALQTGGRKMHLTRRPSNVDSRTSSTDWQSTPPAGTCCPSLDNQTARVHAYMYTHARCSSRLASSGHCLIGKAQTNGCLDTGLMRATPLFHDALAPCFSRLGPDTHARRLEQTAVLAWPWTPPCFVAGTKPCDLGHGGTAPRTRRVHD